MEDVDDKLSARLYDERWFGDVLGDRAGSLEARQKALLHVGEVCQGTVKFFRRDKGWGGLQSPDAPADVWVHYSSIESSGYRELTAGEPVAFRWEPAMQDSWRCRATWVRRLTARPD